MEFLKLRPVSYTHLFLEKESRGKEVAKVIDKQSALVSKMSQQQDEINDILKTLDL